MKNYILNKETMKIELHFTKEEYKGLNENDKKKLKSAFLFSGKVQAWVSRSTQNHYRAINIANELGFEEEIVKGEMLSFEEEIKRKVERAERKQAKYENYSNNAIVRSQELQSEFNSFRGDIAFMTQPIIAGHKGSQSFANRRERILNRYRKGFDEYKKSEYFKDKANQMQNVIDCEKFKDRVYLSNRIKECKKSIKKYEENISWCENNNSDKAEYWLEKLNYTVDKLAYIENCLEAIGGIKYNASNLKVGYEILIRGHWDKVLKLNKTTVESQPIEEHLKMCYGKRDYAEIQDVRIPKDYKAEEIINPFEINELLVAKSFGGDIVIRAYKITKVTEKTVTIREVKVLNNIPTDEFKEESKESRRKIKKGKINGDVYIADDDYILYKYN